MANKFYSPLRYPGGKTKLAPFIKSVLYENGLVGCDYIEPFAGGAGIALSLLFEEYVSTITINDLDRSIYAFWHSIVYENEPFCKKIKSTPITVDEWRKQKKIQENKNNVDLFPLGFSTFFLNRTNVSGIIKGGVIGGLEQKGKYKINARFNKHNLINSIRCIGFYKDKIKVTNLDAQEILKKPFAGDFVYIDPPYVKKAKDLYMNFYHKKDHQTISKTLLSNQSDFRWVLSYDQNELVKSLYSSCKNKVSWNLDYGSSNRQAYEDIFLHNKLKILRSKELLFIS